MPSVGAATVLVINLRLERALKREFQGQELEDARKMLDLSSRAGDTSVLTVVPIIGLCCALMAGMVCMSQKMDITIMHAVVVAIMCLTAYWFVRLLRARSNAKRDFLALLASNPDYWNPIQEKLKRIVLEAGKFDLGQKTKIVH